MSLLAALPLLLALMTWLRMARAGLALLDRTLKDVEPTPPPGGWPSLSVVVPCKDEGETVEPAMATLLAQSYPALEVTAVDDRSTDDTGAKLDALARGDSRLRVAHVAALPPGWLGKNHALAAGAEASRGRWLLFTDADVVFAPDALQRAIAWAEAERLDHVVALPRFVTSGFFERAFVALFGLALIAALRLHELRRPRSRAFVGVGAFNLVRAEAYRACGGHGRLAMEVADDVKLGLILRRSGFRQGCLDSGGLVRVRWQRGFRASVRGLVKNMFAGAEYSWPRTLLAAAGLLIVTTYPFVALFTAPAAATRALAAIVVVVAALVHGRAVRVGSGGRGVEAAGLPIAGVALAAAIVTSALAATLRGAVIWRGTRYPLAELRARCVRERDWPTDRAPG